jgi:hypothetical protein
VSNVLALNGEIAPAPTVGALQRGVLRRPVELTGHNLPHAPQQNQQANSLSYRGADATRLNHPANKPAPLR